MLVTVSTDKSVSDAAAALQTAVQANHFGVMRVHNLKETMENANEQEEQELMVFEVKSAKSLKQIGRDIEEAASRHKFGVLTVHDLQAKMQEKGIEMDREVRIFEVCNPKQAKEVIDANPKVSTALPCRISVYRDGTGYMLSSLRPTETMKVFDDRSIDGVAKEVEDAMIAIMKEAAG